MPTQSTPGVYFISEGKPRKNDVTDEVDDGVIARYDYKSRKVRGLTILDFAKRGKKTTRQVKLPFNIAFGVS